jgi:hypothetical protein
MIGLIRGSRPSLFVLLLGALGAGRSLVGCSSDSSSGGGSEAGALGGHGGSSASGGTSGSAGRREPSDAGASGTGEAGEAGNAGINAGGGGAAGAGTAMGAAAGVSDGGSAEGGASDGGAGGEPGVQCQSAHLLAKTPKAWALAVADGYAYWTTRDVAGKVLRAPITGGASDVLASGELYPYEVAVAGGHAFWATLGASPGHVFQASTTGQGRAQIAIGAFSGLYSLNADANNVYYITNINDVIRVPVGGGDPFKLSAGPYNSVIVDLVLDGPNLFWTNQGIGTFVTTEPESAGVLGVAVSGATAAAPLVNRLEYPQFEIASDATNVFWNDAKAIYRTAKAGGASTQVSALPAAPLANSPIVDLLSDGEHLFYSDGQSVFRSSVLPGAPVEIMTQGWGRIMKLAQDTDSVYFTDYSSGAVAQLSKCAFALSPADFGVAPPIIRAVSDVQPGTRILPADVTCDPATSIHGCPEATPIATAPHAFGLAVDASYVYFSTLDAAGTIQRVPVAGGAAEPIASNEPFPHDLAIDTDSVYWCLNDKPAGHLARSSKAGADRKLLATGIGGGVGRVTSDGKFVYFTTGYNAVYRLPVAGGEAAIIANGPYGSQLSDLAAYDGEVFWVNDGIFNSTFTAKLPKTAYFARAPNTGTANLGRTTLQDGLDSPLQRTALDSTHVYYIDSAFVYSADLAGGAPLKLGPIAPATGTVVDLLSDGQNLYFADLHGVYRMPVGGGAVETLSKGWNSLRSIAVDASKLYFTDYGGGAVLERPK